MKRTPHKYYLSALIILAILASSANAAQYYVAPNGTGTNGLSWSTAYTNLQDAIDAVSPTGDQIWVKANTYTISAAINVNKAVGIYGGFAGTESTLDERQLTTNITTISGGGTTQCFNITADAYIDGFTITAGNAENGGVMYINDCSPTIRNCIFTDNVANTSGGAIYNNQSGATIVNCLFTNNTANTGSGGAVTTTGKSRNVNITNCTLVSNTAAIAGGAIYNTTANPVITNCILWGNSSGNQTYNDVYSDSTSIPTFNHCLIGQDNFASLNGSNNISLHPQFAGVSNYHLTDLSPCVDTGSNSEITGIDDDIEGNTRIKSGTVDIGAYEFPGNPVGIWNENGNIASDNGYGGELGFTMNETMVTDSLWIIDDGSGDNIEFEPVGEYSQTFDTISMVTSGTATKGGETSPYTLNIIGTLEGNTISGTYTIEYENAEWTDDSGTWTVDMDLQASSHVSNMAIEQNKMQGLYGGIIYYIF